MEKYIKEIIEIILDNVSCEHQEREDTLRGPTFDDPIYSLDNEQRVIKKCLAVIPAYAMKFELKTDEKFIEEKTLEFFACLPSEPRKMNQYIHDFIRLFFKELSEKINLKGDWK